MDDSDNLLKNAKQKINMNFKKIISTIELFKKENEINLEFKYKVECFINDLVSVLLDSKTEILSKFSELEKDFLEILVLCYDSTCDSGLNQWESFLTELPEVLKKLSSDAHVFLKRDPAANSLKEVFLAYPGFHSILFYRLSHEFLKLGIPILPRLISEYSHGLTGIDIHPGAKIGGSFFIDHGTGIVIGETVIINDNVSIFQGVTLGGISVNKNLKRKKRHPTIESDVTIYANATILGGDTVIGRNSIIGGNTWITSSIEPDSIVTNNFQVIKKKKMILKV